MGKFSKGLLGLFLSLVVLISALPVSASAQGLDIQITPSVTNAVVGDVIEYTVTATCNDLLAMEFKLELPEGLRYVEGSGAIPLGLKELLGWPEVDWTEETKKWTGFNDYGVEVPAGTVIMTFSAVAEAQGSYEPVLKNLYAYNGDAEVLEPGMSVGSVTVSASKPTKVTGLQATDIEETSFQLTWDSIEGATKYWVYVDGAILSSTTAPGATVTKCTPGTVYRVQITARLADGTVLPLAAAETLEVRTKLIEVTAPTVTAAADAAGITLSWDATGCAKTWIYMGTDQNDLKLLYSCTASPYQITDLQPDTTYYFRLSHSISGKLVWTEETVEAKTPAVNNPTKVSGLKATDIQQTSFEVTWDAIEGASKYWVYVNGTLVSSTTTSGATVKKCTAGTVYQVQITARLKDNSVLALAKAEVLTVKTQGQALVAPVATVTAGPGSLTLNWNNANCTKTWIYLGTDPADMKLVDSCTTGTYTALDLEGDTKYYIRLSHYMGGKVVLSDVILEATTQARLDLAVKAQLSGDQLTLDWEANGNSYKYWISVVCDGKTKVYSTTDTCYTLADFDPATCTVSIRGIHSKGTYDYDRIVV